MSSIERSPVRFWLGIPVLLLVVSILLVELTLYASLRVLNSVSERLLFRRRRRTEKVHTHLSLVLRYFSFSILFFICPFLSSILHTRFFLALSLSRSLSIYFSIFQCLFLFLNLSFLLCCFLQLSFFLSLSFVLFSLIHLSRYIGVWYSSRLQRGNDRDLLL